MCVALTEENTTPRETDASPSHQSDARVSQSRRTSLTTLLTDLVAGMQNEIEKLLQVVENHPIEKYGMKISIKKTKAMVITRSKEVPSMNLNVEGKPVSQVDKFMYLAHQVEESGRCDGDIRRRIEIMRFVYIKMRDILTSRKVKLATRKRILRCYGSETWTLIKDTMRID